MPMGPAVHGLLCFSGSIICISGKKAYQDRNEGSVPCCGMLLQIRPKVWPTPNI